MRTNQGIALITSLIVLFVVATLGVGASFLAQMNLSIAENTRTHVVARYHSETGLDTALVILAREFRNREGRFPTPTEFRALFPGTADYQLVHYELFANDQGTISIRGQVTARNAEHVAEARFRGVGTPTDITTQQDPRFGVGFVSNGSITFPGNSALELNLWSGNEIDFTGGKSSLGAGFWARTSGGHCEIGKIPCTTGADPPRVTGPNFAALREQVIAHYMALRGVATEEALYNETITQSQTLHNQTNRIIRLGSGVQLTLTGAVSNLVIIGDETNTVRLDADVNVRREEQGRGRDKKTVESCTDELMGVTIVSGTVNLESNSTAMCGQNTIIARNDIEFNKGVLSLDSNARTLLATEGNIRLNGNGGRDIFATFWAGGEFRVNGTIGDFIGTVVAATSATAITGKGGVDRARLPDHLLNPFIPTIVTRQGFTDAGIQVLSRR
jgi:hypothetical protein